MIFCKNTMFPLGFTPFRESNARNCHRSEHQTLSGSLNVLAKGRSDSERNTNSRRAIKTQIRAFLWRHGKRCISVKIRLKKWALLLNSLAYGSIQRAVNYRSSLILESNITIYAGVKRNLHFPKSTVLPTKSHNTRL